MPPAEAMEILAVLSIFATLVVFAIMMTLLGAIVLFDEVILRRLIPSLRRQ